jgi:protein-L-isoaspartate(D-aspartate) O-methyltransferase
VNKPAIPLEAALKRALMTFSQILLVVLFVTRAVSEVEALNFTAERQQMVKEIDAMVAATEHATGVAKLDKRVREAMSVVPRHEFVPAPARSSAYRNRPLPIGKGQTISQPFIVALMTELLQLEKTGKVLEVGTGSGYQAAILSLLVRDVYTLEIVPSLAKAAQATLGRLGYGNVHTSVGDGYLGWPEQAPFDAIIVTAAPDHIPPALVEQLRTGGKMVIPVGTSRQELMVLTKNANGTTSMRTVAPVTFVPLTR